MSDDLPRKRIKKSGKKKKRNPSGGQWLLVFGAVVALAIVGGLGYWLLGQNLMGGGMVTFEHSEGGFSCKLPKAPERRPEWDAPGKEAFGYTDLESKREYVIMFVKLDPSSLAMSARQRELEDAAESTISAYTLGKFTGPVRRESRYTNQAGLETINFKATKPNGASGNATMSGRYFFHRNNMLQFHLFNEGTDDPMEAERFFNSVQLIP